MLSTASGEQFAPILQGDPGPVNFPTRSKYGLTLHPDKTRLIPFRPPVDRKDPGSGKCDGPRQLRPARLHAFLGAVTARLLGGQMQDGQRAVRPCATAYRRVVPEGAAPAYPRAARGLSTEAARTLRVRRHHWELAGVGTLQVRGGADLAQVVRDAIVACTEELDLVHGPASSPSAALAARRPLGARSRSEALT